MPRVLMTGAAGGIGTSLRKLLPPIYPDLLLSDLKAPADLGAKEKFKAAELSDLAQVEAICEGIDGILHFGGFSVEGPWDAMLQSNIIGAYDLGYRPTGRAEEFREHAFAEQAKLPPDPVGDFYQGGTFCSMEFDGDA